MSAFLFQCVPERFDLRTAIRPGQRDTWYATRHRTAMRSGEPVFFWMAGAEEGRGLYGWGRLASEPYLQPDWDVHGVDVVYAGRFTRPALARDLRSDPVLAGMLIFRAPQATNFLLPDDQAARLVAVLQARGETVPTLAQEAR